MKGVNWEFFLTPLMQHRLFRFVIFPMAPVRRYLRWNELPLLAIRELPIVLLFFWEYYSQYTSGDGGSPKLFNAPDLSLNGTHISPMFALNPFPFDRPLPIWPHVVQ